MFGRNPEVPEDLLSDNPDVIVNSAVLHDPPAISAAKVRSVARQNVLAYNDKLAVRTALDARPPTLRSFQNGEMVAVWRKNRGASGSSTKWAHHRWRPGICMGQVRGNYWIAVPGSCIKASANQLRLANREERAAWRLVEASLRSHTIDLDSMKANYYDDITKDGDPPSAPGPVPESEGPLPTAPVPPAPEEAAPDEPEVDGPDDPHDPLFDVPLPGDEHDDDLKDGRDRSDEPPKKAMNTLSRQAPKYHLVTKTPDPEYRVGESLPQKKRQRVAIVEDALRCTVMDEDEILVVDETCVLLAQGRKELDKRAPQWRSNEGQQKIIAGFAKELNKLITVKGAWVPKSLEESRRIRSTMPDRILAPRPVLTASQDESGQEVAKRRLTIQGFKDPDVLELVRAGRTQSPTLSSNGRTFVLQTIASARFPLNIGNADGAFLETDATLAQAEHGPLYVTLPKEFTPEGLHPNQLCEVINGYGRCDQPRLWWQTFSRFCINELGFISHPMDACVLILFEDLKKHDSDFDMDKIRIIGGSGAEVLRSA